MLLASPGNRQVRECVFVCINCDQWWHFSLKHSCERIYRRNDSYRQPEILWFPSKCQVVFPSGRENFAQVCYYDLRLPDVEHEGICKAENRGAHVWLAYIIIFFFSMINFRWLFIKGFYWCFLLDLLFVVVCVKVKKKGWREPLKHFMDIIDHICFPLLFYCHGSLW